MIEEYHFGSITVNGKNYNNDVEVRWTGKILEWWRKNGHIVVTEDLKRAIGQNPEFIIIGTGESEMVKIPEQAQEEIHSKGIKLVIDKTREAAKSFNILEKKGRKVIGFFHLTC